MNIMMLSWEYPPLTEGGLARHVHDLAVELVRQGDNISVITRGGEKLPEFEVSDGVSVYRVSEYNLPADGLLNWTSYLNMALMEKAVRVINSDPDIQLIHVHDWLTAFAGRMLKYSYQLPLLATIHATEYGRNNGLHNSLNNSISNIEWWLTYEAWKVIVCSNYMKQELQHIFQLPEDKLQVIVNGVNTTNVSNYDLSIRRRNYAADDERIILYIGRLVREKGVQTLLAAVPLVLQQFPRTKFIISGKGPFVSELQAIARNLHINDKVYFTGFINDNVRNALLNWAEVAVFPSLYEPFGIAVLEAMAAKVPVVVSDVGGMSEIVRHGENGMKAYCNNAGSLADNIIYLLKEPQKAKIITDNAIREIEDKYNWRNIAVKTRRLYQEIITESENKNWHSKIKREARR